MNAPCPDWRRRYALISFNLSRDYAGSSATGQLSFCADMVDASPRCYLQETPSSAAHMSPERQAPSRRARRQRHATRGRRSRLFAMRLFRPGCWRRLAGQLGSLGHAGERCWRLAMGRFDCRSPIREAHSATFDEARRVDAVAERRRRGCECHRGS